MVSGTMPTQLGALTDLDVLLLEAFYMSGSFPTQLGTLTALNQMAINQNELSGSLPTQLGSLAALCEMSLEENRLDGTLPTQLGALGNLTKMRLAHNHLSGTLPTQLGVVPVLEDMDIQTNSLSGSLPTQLGTLTALITLQLGFNVCSGSLPKQLGVLTTLEEMYLEVNWLSGSLPTQLGVLTMLEGMSLEHNHLSGILPTQLGELTMLEEMYLESNQLSGILPTQLGALQKDNHWTTLNWCNLGGTNNFRCPIPVETPLLCTASLAHMCSALHDNSSDAVRLPAVDSPGAVPLWVYILLPLGLLLVVVLRLLCRMSRDRSNLRLSRDRANLDLQLMAHQIQRGQIQPNDLASQADSQSERPYSSLVGATVASLPPGPPSSSAASATGAAAASPPPKPTPSSNGKGKGKRKAEAGKTEVPPTWAGLDRQFYETAAGKAHLAEAALASPSTAPSTSAACASSVVQALGLEAFHGSNNPIKRPFAGSEQAVPQLAEVSPAQLAKKAQADSDCALPAPLAKKATPRRLTAEGVEIHALLQPAVSLQQGARRIWDRHVSRRWEALSDAERTQHHRNMAPFPVPTPAPAPLPPLVAARGAAAPSLDGLWDAHRRARDARDAATPPERAAPHAPAPTPAPTINQRVEPLVEVESDQQQHTQNAGAARNVTGRTAQDTSDPAGSDMVRLSDLAELTELLNQDDEAVVLALSSHPYFSG
jgi:Leucine-rich repeat (LRR) protein